MKVEFCPFCGGNEIFHGHCDQMIFCHGCKKYISTVELPPEEWTYLDEKISMMETEMQRLLRLSRRNAVYGSFEKFGRDDCDES